MNPQHDCHCCCIGVQPPAQDSLSIIVDTSDSDTFCLLPETPAATRRRSDDFSSSCEGDVFVVFVRALRPPCPSPMRFVHALRPCSSSVCFILRLWHYRHHLHRLHCGIAVQNWNTVYFARNRERIERRNTKKEEYNNQPREEEDEGGGECLGGDGDGDWVGDEIVRNSNTYYVT